MLQDQGNQPEATAFLFFGGVVVDKGQSQQASRWGQQNWTSAVDLDGETLSVESSVFSKSPQCWWIS